MNENFGDYLSPLTSYLDEDLSDSKSRDMILKHLEEYPGIISSAFGFETSLNDNAKRLDFAFGVLSHERDYILSLRNKFPLSSQWTALIGLCERWEGADDKFKKDIFALWVEQDMKEGAFPAYFVGIKEQEYSPGYLKNLFRFILFEMFGKMQLPPSSVIENINHALENIPPGGLVFQMGTLPSRIPSVYRLCILGLTKETLPAYLEKLKMDKEFISEFMEKNEPLWNLAQRLILHLDIGEKIYSRLGLELRFLNKELTLEGQQRWQGILDWMITKGGAKAEKIRALKKWPGSSRELHSPGFITLRLLYYIKGVYLPQQSPVYKSYFGYVNYPIKEK